MMSDRTFVYRLATAADWEQAQRNGALAASDLDQRGTIRIK